VFEVVFQGKVTAGSDIQQVRQNLGRMFKADDAKLNALFSGKTVVIKSGLDKATADKYLAALNKAGAQAEIREVGAEKAAPVAKNPASFMAKDFSKPSLSSVAQAHSERQEEIEEQTKVEKEPEPVGIPVPEVQEASTDEVRQAMDALAKQEKKAEEPSPAAQTSAPAAEQSDPSSVPETDFSLAPTGSMIPNEKKKEQEVVPDTDHLTVKPMDGYLVDPEPEKEVQVPDTSHLKIEE